MGFVCAVIGMAAAVLHRGIDPATAQGAARPLLQLIGAEAKVGISVEVGLSRRELIERLQSGALNLASASADDYLAIASQVKVRPLLRGVWLGSSTFRLDLMVDRASGISQVKDLAGKTVSVYAHDRIQRLFLETALARARTTAAVRERSDGQSPVLDVLFREASACLVSDRVFATMSRLNPQLARRLTVIARSVPIPTAPLFVRADLEPTLVASLVKHGTQLHTRVHGRQALLLFRLERLVETRPADFKPLEALLAEHRRLTRP